MDAGLGLPFAGEVFRIKIGFADRAQTVADLALSRLYEGRYPVPNVRFILPECPATVTAHGDQTLSAEINVCGAKSRSSRFVNVLHTYGVDERQVAGAV